jgi:signal transduction histidine kinase
LRVLGDRNLIAQMLSNLLDNAIKYCAPGDRVTLELAAAEDRHVMRVADTGPGLPADMKGEAFERFVRADRDRGIKGHGLGLALVRAIAVRHGARLVLPEGSEGFALEIHWPRLQQSE